MIAVIHQWRVLSGHEPAHQERMRDILRLQREACPEVLMNLSFGPSAEGVAAEVQFFPSAEAYHAFAARVRREVPILQQVWDRHQEVCVPGSLESVLFEDTELVAQSFVRPSVAIGQAAST